ncbi:oxalate/formate antiporter [Schistosoma japonicum]|nr:oxalate/formate antiporter [Schistosoma japonicum]
MLWFPEKRGLIVGIIVSGFGLGALVFSPIQTALINPTNIKVDNVTRQLEFMNKVGEFKILSKMNLLANQIFQKCLATESQIKNKSSHFTDVELLGRVPRTLLILGGILLGIQIIGFILLRPRPNAKQVGNILTNSHLNNIKNYSSIQINFS